jgi:hypothetical protein
LQIRGPRALLLIFVEAGSERSAAVAVVRTLALIRARGTRIMRVQDVSVRLDPREGR